MFFYVKICFQMTTKVKGGIGVGVKALVVGPIKNNFFET